MIAAHKLGLGPRLAVLRLAATVALTTGPAMADTYEQASTEADRCRTEVAWVEQTSPGDWTAVCPDPDCATIAGWAYELAELGDLEMRGDAAYELALSTCVEAGGAR